MKFEMNVFFMPDTIATGEKVEVDGARSEYLDNFMKALEAQGKSVDPADVKTTNLKIASAFTSLKRINKKEDTALVTALDCEKKFISRGDGGRALQMIIDQKIFNRVKYYPDIQFVRRHTGMLRTDTPPTVLCTLKWDNEKGYQSSDNFKFPNDVDYMTGTVGVFGFPASGNKDRIKAIIQGEDQKNPPEHPSKPNFEISPFYVPRFSFFFNKDRIGGFDSFVRIHNLFMYTDSPTKPVCKDFHDFKEKNLSTTVPEIESGRTMKHYYTSTTPGTKYHAYEDYEDLVQVHPIHNDGNTIVIDVDDQFNRALLAAPLLLPLLSLPALIPLISKKGGSDGKDKTGDGDDTTTVINSFDYSLRICDITDKYVKSFDGQKVGIITDYGKGKIPVSSYYYGTNPVVDTNAFDGDSIKEGRKYTVQIFASGNGGSSPVSDSADFVSGKKKGGKSSASGAGGKNIFDFSKYLKQDYNPLPIGDYLVCVIDSEDSTKYVGMVLSIVAPDAQISLKDNTSKDSEPNKDLVTAGFGSITNIRGGKYSKYKVGSQLTAYAGYNYNVTGKLQIDTQQIWSLGLYKASDTKFSEPIWEVKDVKYDDPMNKDDVTTLHPIKKSKDEWLDLESGDYVLRAQGSTKYGRTEEKSQDLIVISIRNYLAIEDKTEMGQQGQREQGFFQPMYSNDRQIAGPLDVSKDLYLKSSSYYTEDLPYTKLLLSFNDKKEHEFKKVMANVSNGEEIKLGGDDKFDAELGGYVLDMRLSNGKDIDPGTYKLTCYDTSEKEIFDDLLLVLINKATIKISFASNTTMGGDFIGISSGILSGTVVYTSALTDPVKIAGFVEVFGSYGDELLLTADLFGSTEQSSGSSGEKDPDGRTIFNMIPNQPLSFTFSMPNAGLGASRIRVYAYDIDNKNINIDQKYNIANDSRPGGGGSGDTNSSVLYSKKKSSKKKF